MANSIPFGRIKTVFITLVDENNETYTATGSLCNWETSTAVYDYDTMLMVEILVDGEITIGKTIYSAPVVSKANDIFGDISLLLEQLFDEHSA